MKKAKFSFARCLPVCLLLCVMIPYVFISVLAVVLPYSAMSEQCRAEHTRVMTMNGDRIEQHVGCVSDAVTLLLDSKPLRESLKVLDDTNGVIKPEDIYYAIGMPISYRNVLSNRAISAVTIYSEGRLAYYSMQQTTTDLALTRCGTMLYNVTDIPEGGGYFVPRISNGYIYFIRDYTDLYEGRQLGHLVIEVEAMPTYHTTNDQMVGAYDYQVDLSGYPGTQYYVYDTGGTVIFSHDTQNVGAKLEQVLPVEYLSSSTAIASEIEGYSVVSRQLYKPLLTAVMLTPESSIVAGAGANQKELLTIAAVIGLLLLAAVFILTERLTAPLRALEHYCRETREQPSAPPAFDPRFREVEAVQETLAARAEKIDEMQAVIMKNHLKMKDNEIQLLQAQISPHFLFNMLDIIGWQAAQDQNVNVSEMVNHLGGLLRNNILLNRQDKITIGQEVQYIKDYLALEQIRHAGLFTYSIEADDELLNTCYIPKLSIQPIVENCVVHGFEGLTRQGVIEIRIWEDVDGVRCIVRDNGVGFHADGWFERAVSLPPDPKRSHIALHNIQERIKMLCGPEYGIEIKSIPGAGTEVMITLPLDEKKED